MKMFSVLKSGLMAVAVAGLSVTTLSASANLLANPGFEDPVTTDGAPFQGSWEAFSDGAVGSSNNGTTMPRTGAQELDLALNGANGFAGAFQEVLANAGDTVTFSGYHKDLAGTNGAGIEIRLEFRDTVSDTEVSRTPNMTPASLGSSYELFSLTDVMPAGSDAVRVVYAIQSFGGVNTQEIYVDDTSFVVVPEPATAALLGLGGLAMLRRRVA